MKKWLSWLAGFFLLLTISGGANASTMYDVTKDPQEDIYISWFGSYTWTFDIGDLPSETVTSAYIRLYLSDDSRGWDEIVPELVEISFDDDAEWALNWSISGMYTINIDSLAPLNEDGTLTVTLTSYLGDFYFDSATLYTTTTTDIDPVPNPEPATFLLVGLGLLGFAGTIRRRIRS